MKLYTSPSGPGPRRIQHFLTLKKIGDFEQVNLDIARGETRLPEFLKINPSGRIPVLITDDGDCLFESAAIIQYLEECFPDPPMQGVSEEERRRVDLQATYINEFFHACFLSTTHLSPYVSRFLTQAPEVDIVTRPLWWMRLQQVSDVMGASRYLAGDAPTLADCLLFPMLEYIKAMYGFMIPPHQRSLYAWYARFLELPGITELELSPGYHEIFCERYGTLL